ncbi:MAG: galactosyltransferase-related protein [Melioribacteraceae bacterium]|nr:galactosyltransferase-related protein [Melioribacteraceae bacterium]
MIKVSLVMASFLRSNLLDLSLYSITNYKIAFPLEIIVVNDGIEDDTEAICTSYKDKLDIKYFFSGHRNKDKVVRRSPVFANNIAVKKATGDIIVLTCPEIYHLNNCLNIIVEPLFTNRKFLTIPEFMYFDDIGKFTKMVSYSIIEMLPVNATSKDAVQMPFFMGMWKKEFLDIGGYDEDLIGYAGDDNDLVGRLLKNGCHYNRVPALIVHLFHGKRCDSQMHWDNPDQVYNYKIIQARKGQIIRNINREYGIL